MKKSIGKFLAFMGLAAAMQDSNTKHIEIHHHDFPNDVMLKTFGKSTVFGFSRSHKIRAKRLAAHNERCRPKNRK